jgi:type II secretory ATPase GspE/PulE/Tfp pilus assembly ATPase PilB-like protein
MPTVYGEKAVMRLLEKQNTVANLERVGFLPDQRTLFDRFLDRPHGLILVTGPTGSGKSTTLYAALQAINDPTININTVEDPVEYKLPGVNQMQANPKIGVSFASGLRTLLRQDPDVILVGEIRDRETAEIAIQAALTGHLVLSTLHTNDAPSALVRLRNMGIEPFLVSSAVLGVVGQRLLRTICSSCREVYPATQELVDALEIEIPGGGLPTFARGVGCKRCGGRGTRGRTGAMEIVTMSDALRQMVLRDVSGSELYDQALTEGMVTMRQAAIRKVIDHQVPAQEIVRVFSKEL